MSFIDEVRAKRKKLADVLSDADYSGIREIVEELYPDKAHFIYELLQNAEDTGANAVTFTLLPDRLLFEHNGDPFSEDDVWGITNIGKGTKKADDEAIGRFGVGFKAVFAYTDTPRIWSPTISFEISELVLPSQLSPILALGNSTRFEFPFNNPKKPTTDAYAEIQDGLNELSETTLLFLSHIESIAWKRPGKSSGEVLRITHSEQHIEVLKQIDGKTTGSSHYLRFTKPVEGLEKQRIAIAFAMDLLPKVDGFNSKKPLAQQLRVVPANPGLVAVFFPAEKEISGLRFHLHAPFVPELSRASIKETPANTPLYRQIASLVSQSLHVIRDIDLLTGDFLSVLPNAQDRIASRYDGIRKSIVEAMNEKALTPSYPKGHSPARHLLQAKASLKNLLSMADIEFLVDYDDSPPRWAIAATQKNSDVDRFLDGLAIREWDTEEFIGVFEEKAADNAYSDPEDDFMQWLASKTDEWHQRLYAYWYRELEPEGDLGRLKELCIVRLSNGQHSVAGSSFFPTDEVDDDDALPRVSKAVYTSGKSKTEQESARKLLAEIGVREVGEVEQIEALLHQRYLNEGFDPQIADIKRFVALVEKEPDAAQLFKDYWIFLREDGQWGKPGQVYLDAPYLDTELRAYYNAFGKNADRVALSKDYRDGGVSSKRLGEFARRVGVSCQLAIKEVSCRSNPEVHNLVWRAPGSETSYKIDRDYQIQGLDKILDGSSEPLSRLVWRTCANLKYPDWTKAQYRSNRNHHPPNEAPSQLVVLLRSRPWIPQVGGAFVCPAEAARDLLPNGFAFDPGWPWLKAIQFGESIAKQSAESRRKREVAKELGFKDEDSLNDAKWFAELDPEERQRFKVGYENRHRAELPEHEPVNPGRRADRVQQEALEAPERRTEMRTRAVSVGRESVKKDTDPYLRQQYTNGDGEAICQVCKTALPFKLADGSYYLEAVEFLPELKRRHYQNYLALCPNHAAMFQHANDSRDLIKDLFLDMEGNELEVILADENASIYFTKTHITDIKAVILADDAGKGEEE